MPCRVSAGVHGLRLPELTDLVHYHSIDNGFLFTSVLKFFVERSLLGGHLVFEKGGSQDTCLSLCVRIDIQDRWATPRVTIQPQGQNS